jgi:hypothetical protein
MKNHERIRGTIEKSYGKSREEKIKEKMQTKRYGIPHQHEHCQKRTKYKDALRILKHRLEFFRGKHIEAGGKELMYRVLASEPELEILEKIENMYEPTNYTPKDNCFVPYITPEIARHVLIIYNEICSKKDETDGEISTGH